MKKVLVLLCTVLSLWGFGQAPKFEIADSEVKSLRSTIVPGQEYRLTIMLPGGYERSAQKYPVVYLMDAQWDFPLLTALYGQQYYDGFVPPMIIVGVTWGGARPNPDSLRARDYTPTREARLPQSGGAASFLSVLKKEVMPYVEANFKASSQDRTLMGCSLGGLFTLYALFTEPALFQRYVAATPAIAWDQEVIYTYEKAFFEKNAAAKARLYLCVGGVERGVPQYQKMVRHLQGRGYKNLDLKSSVLENTGHSGTKGEGYARGLQYVFERPSLKLPAATLQRYAGRYQLEGGGVVTLQPENNGLVLHVAPDNKLPLQAASESLFYTTAEFLNLQFEQGAQKDITGFQLQRYGGTQKAKKL